MGKTDKLSARQSFDVIRRGLTREHAPRRRAGMILHVEQAHHAAVGSPASESMLRFFLSTGPTMRDGHFGLVVPMHCDLYPRNGRPARSIAEEWTAHAGARCIPLKFFLPGECLHWIAPRETPPLRETTTAGSCPPLNWCQAIRVTVGRVEPEPDVESVLQRSGRIEDLDSGLERAPPRHGQAR